MRVDPRSSRGQALSLEGEVKKVPALPSGMKNALSCVRDTENPSMSFHEILFPLDIALKSAGGPERRTEIVTFGSGREARNARWAHSRRRYDAGYGVKSLASLQAVGALFEERPRQLHGRRWRDPLRPFRAPPRRPPPPLHPGHRTRAAAQATLH